MQLFRALLPQWNFFDRLTGQFALHVQVQNSAEPQSNAPPTPGESTPWTLISFLQPSRAHQLFWNPQTNLALAQINVLEHFAMDLEELTHNPLQQRRLRPLPSLELSHAKVEALTSFALVRALVLHQINKSNVAQYFRFQLTQENPTQVLYTSNWMHTTDQTQAAQETQPN